MTTANTANTANTTRVSVIATFALTMADFLESEAIERALTVEAADDATEKARAIYLAERASKVYAPMILRAMLSDIDEAVAAGAWVNKDRLATIREACEQFVANPSEDAARRIQDAAYWNGDCSMLGGHEIDSMRCTVNNTSLWARLCLHDAKRMAAGEFGTPGTPFAYIRALPATLKRMAVHSALCLQLVAGWLPSEKDIDKMRALYDEDLAKMLAMSGAA